MNNVRRIDTSLPGLRCYRFHGMETDNLFPASYELIVPGRSCKEGQCDLAQRTSRDEDSLQDWTSALPFTEALLHLESL